MTFIICKITKQKRHSQDKWRITYLLQSNEAEVKLHGNGEYFIRFSFFILFCYLLFRMSNLKHGFRTY